MLVEIFNWLWLSCVHQGIIIELGKVLPNRLFVTVLLNLQFWWQCIKKQGTIKMIHSLIKEYQCLEANMKAKQCVIEKYQSYV